MRLTFNGDLSTDSGIAVIGMACRLPGAHNADEFWRNLRAGIASITFFNNGARVGKQNPSNVDSQSRTAAIIDDADLFDAKFFGYTPREAEIMDPQHRLFLECAWEAMEHAGYDPHSYRGLAGVFAGSGFCTYLLNHLLPNRADLHEITEAQIAAGNERDALASTVSYNLNLTGPSLVVQTFCSTSLVAIHLACQSLLSSECDLALAGAVEVSFPQEKGYHHQIDGVTCLDGQTRTFDARAQGCVKGNGLGIVVLKRVENAISDGDFIYAVIKGSAVNNDGLKVNYLTPGFDGQTAIIVEALANAGISAETIGYVEAHGSATLLGDSIEIAAATKAFRVNTDKKHFCAVGSSKTNIGNLERASGIAGFIKTVLALHHRELPPSLNFDCANPEIDFDSSPFYVNTKLSAWQSDGVLPRRAGISSFGMGGTNAHVVLEEAPRAEPSGLSRPVQLLAISAKTPAALRIATKNLLQYLESNPGTNIADIAFTLLLGRKAFSYRSMVTCEGLESARKGLQVLADESVCSSYQKARQSPVTFFFPGLGDHYLNMAHGLYCNEQFFRWQVEQCSEILRPYLQLDLREVLFPTGKDSGLPVASSSSVSTDRGGTRQVAVSLPSAVADQAKRTALADPALFVIEYALAQLLMNWGIRPSAMFGCGIGEYVAATLAGILSIEDALMVVARRAALIDQLKEGAMLAVALPDREIQPRMSQQIWIAEVKTSHSCVVAGSTLAVEELRTRLEQEQVVTRRLHTAHAYHTPMLMSLAEEVRQLVQSVKLRPPEIACVSGVTGKLLNEQEATDVEYWVTQMSSPVQMKAGLQSLLEQTRSAVLVEVGPRETLGSRALLEETVLENPAEISVLSASEEEPGRITAIGTLRPHSVKMSDERVLVEAVGRLWQTGVEINWEKYYEGEQRQRVGLPTYPFERQRFWIESKDIAS